MIVFTTRRRVSQPDHWQAVSSLLDQLLDLEPGRRHAWLAETCAGDPALRREVEELLARGEEGDHFLDRPAADFAGPILAHAGEAPANLAEGRQVGPYRIIGEAGHGGMGTVYLAERADDQYRKRVALKVVLGGMLAGQDAVRRFLDERQILAGLDHPNIARLIDGGITEDGLPWFAMEYVEGEPIDRYVRTRSLPIEGRVALFLAICDAVGYAHRSLVVHRDLKPSNILVSAEAGEAARLRHRKAARG